MRYSPIVIVLLFIANLATAQPLSFNFKKVTTADGLNMSSTTAICEDKYGYIWIGTVNGLNRYDGYSVKVYEHIFGDSTSLIPSPVRYIFSDSQGRLLISFLNGVMEYDYAKDSFKSHGKGQIDWRWVTNIVEGSPGLLYLATGGGLAKLNTATGKVTRFDSLNTAGRAWPSGIRDISKYKNELYITTRSSVAVFNLDTEKHRQITLPPILEGKDIGKLVVSPDGTVWAAMYGESGVIFRTTTRFDVWKKYTELTRSSLGDTNSINHLLLDRKGRLWVASTLNGIARYDPATDAFRSARIEHWMPNGILSSRLGQMYQDRNGWIWAESPKGVCFFNPDNTLFQTILPKHNADADENLVAARTAAETADGKLWLGTGHGVFRYDPVSGRYEHFANEPGKSPVLQHNSVRSVFLDRRGDLWVATAKGINRLRAGSRTIEFMDEKDGLPRVISKAIHESRDGTMWIANFSDGGHCYRPPGTSKFQSLRAHPVLGPYAGGFGQCIFEDSRGRMWFGLDGLGLLYYDPVAQQAKYWQRTPQNDSTLAGNYVFSICEDPTGKIWAGTSAGLTSIDPATFHFTNYDRARGLPTNRITIVRADKYNRLWLGTAQGLLLMDSTRKYIRQFDIQDGLPDNEFSDRPSIQLHNGSFLFPSQLGFVLFNPGDFSPDQRVLPLLLSQVRVFNKPFGATTNSENLTELYLPPGNNFFSLDITALNYANPQQTWYAYKMEPYDKDWTFTRARTANYTNVPGGTYTFRYKASTDPNNWDLPEKSLKIRVGEYWYQSAWFWWAGILAAAALFALSLRRRAVIREAFLSLERKSQALSKEKALVQYENLTQQLNPHFLFNSLASLGSLIRFDTKTASEFLEALSKMYRYILQSRERETVSIQEENAFVEHFIKLQKTRFEDALVVNVHIGPEYNERKIVPVTLQNLLENALKHNTFDTEDPLIVDIFPENNYLVVRNNLQRRTVVETSNKQGLTRLKSLYQYLTDAPMIIEETTDYFTVKIPLL